MLKYERISFQYEKKNHPNAFKSYIPSFLQNFITRNTTPITTHMIMIDIIIQNEATPKSYLYMVAFYLSINCSRMSLKNVVNTTLVFMDGGYSS